MSLQKINWSQIDTDPFFGDVDLGTQENYLKNVFTENLYVSGITAGTLNVLSSDILTKISGGTDISINGGTTGITITNTSPDQTVTISGGTGIQTGGTYPNFTITNTSPDQTVTISGGTGIQTGGTYPNFTITNSSPDQTVTITGGTNIEVTGTYPNFGINFTGVTGDAVFTGGTVIGETIFLSGITGATIVGDTFFGNGSGLTNVNIFTNTGTTTIGLGGISNGTVLFGKTVQEIWDLMFFPYEEPLFASFTVNPSLPTFEVGQSVTAGTKLYTWSVQHPQNLSANTLSIIEYTGTTEFRTIDSGFSGTSKTITTTIPTFSSETPTTQTIYKIEGYNTQGNLFTRSINANWRHRWYYGKYSGSSVTNNEITGLTTTLVSNVVNNYVTLNSTLNPEYGYFIIPTGLTQPTDLRNSTSGCQGSNVPYTNEGTVIITNTYGLPVTYRIYKTVNLFAGTTNVWFCNI